jgi:hypothetical protein
MKCEQKVTKWRVWGGRKTLVALRPRMYSDAHLASRDAIVASYDAI